MGCAVWGLGHTVTIVLVGGAIILFNVVIPARLGLLMELSVGFMLVVLGVMNVTNTNHAPRNWLSRETDQRHAPASGWYRPRPGRFGRCRLAGSHDDSYTVWAIAYLLVFGLGTVLGMLVVTTLMAMPFAYTSRQFKTTNRRLQLATGVISIGFGVLLTYKIGYLDGLFTAAPLWTPR